MTGSRLYQRVTARAGALSEGELADPKLEVDLWAVVLRDRGVARRLVEYLRAHPTLLELEAPAFARAVTTVPGVEQGIAGQVLAVFALRGHLELMVAGEPAQEDETLAAGGSDGGVRRGGVAA